MSEFLHRQWRKFRHFLHSKDALIYLLFVLFATFIWFVNAFSTRRTITMVIPVTYTNVPDDYIFTTPPTNHVHVTLDDEGLDLFHNRKRLYELTFDLKGHIHGAEGSFTIPMDELRQAITQQLTGDAGLVAFEPELLTGSYTRQHEKEVPIVYTGQVKPAAQHQLCGEVKLSPSVAHIYGTQQALKAITQIETCLTDYEGVQDTFNTRLALIAPENIRVVPDTVDLQVIAEQFTEKAMKLNIRTPDLSARRQKLHLFPEQVTVTFRIGTARFNSVSEKDIKVYVDMPKKDNEHLPVHVESRNPHITHIRVKPDEVEYLIENYETHTDGRSAAPVSKD